MLNIILEVLISLFSLVLIYPLLLTCWYWIARVPKTTISTDSGKNSYGCIITAYRQLDIVVPLVKSLIAQKYTDFEIYLVADNCETENLSNISRKTSRIISPGGFELEIEINRIWNA